MHDISFASGVARYAEQLHIRTPKSHSIRTRPHPGCLGRSCDRSDAESSAVREPHQEHSSGQSQRSRAPRHDLDHVAGTCSSPATQVLSFVRRHRLCAERRARRISPSTTVRLSAPSLPAGSEGHRPLRMPCAQIFRTHGFICTSSRALTDALRQRGLLDLSWADADGWLTSALRGTARACRVQASALGAASSKHPVG
jgi:hypothetical protein